MSDRVWVLGAGGPAGFNVAAAARAAGYQVVGVDSEETHLPFAESVCTETRCQQGTVVPLLAIAHDELVLPQPEALVRYCAWNADVRFHGPRLSVIDLLADKAAAVSAWHKAGLRRHPSFPVGSEIPDYLHLAQGTLGSPFWLRARSGAGARGALLVEDLRSAFHWIRLHETMGRAQAEDFIAEEYLPGREFCWTAVYHRGERMASFSRERLEWIYPHLAISGRTGTPVHCRVVHDSDVRSVASAAVASIDDEPHGVYCVDLREDEEGIPRPTEINAGRWATTSPLYRHFGPNLVGLQIELALGHIVSAPGDDPYPAGAEMLRHIDMGLRVRP